MEMLVQPAQLWRPTTSFRFRKLWQDDEKIRAFFPKKTHNLQINVICQRQKQNFAKISDDITR